MSSDSQVTKRIEQFVISFLQKQNGSVARSKIIDAILQEVGGSLYTTANATISSMKIKKLIEQKGYGLWGLPGQGSDVEKTEAVVKLDHAEFVETTSEQVHESFFYQPFADWLVNDVVECTHALALGRNVLKDKWATPDVIGVYRVHDQERYKGDEITSFVSAEIKLENSGDATIKGFGQACAYLEFSHKVYLVLPDTISPENKRRVESLAQIVGLGLVFFVPSKKESTPFEIRVRPLLREPSPSALNGVLMREEIFRKLK